MKRLLPFLLAVASGLLMALALPIVVLPLSLRELEPRGWLELVAWFALVPALLALADAARGRRAFALGFVAGLACFFAA
ncbi:MAG TPA: apolipoprotein N-acyltransferase, partial [Anaeromyxobacteraceae bacterium]|nr:apolipoprotein N-acyltransferase [Anaeromyxobacteraceae bacterium]